MLADVRAARTIEHMGKHSQLNVGRYRVESSLTSTVQISYIGVLLNAQKVRTDLEDRAVEDKILAILALRNTRVCIGKSMFMIRCISNLDS